MTHDLDQERQRRLAITLAEAQLRVLACQEQATRKRELLAEARAAMRDAMERLEGARRLQDQIASMPLLWDKKREP